MLHPAKTGFPSCPSPTPTPPPPRRRPSALVRWSRKARDVRVLAGLRNGASVEALAKREGLSARRMRVLVKALLDAHPDLEPADAFTQMRFQHLDRAVENLENDVLVGSRNGSGQMLNIAREYARLAAVEGAHSVQTSPETEITDLKSEILGPKTES